MSKSSYMKRKGGTTVTKKMQAERMDDMAVLMTAMEATLMEWEIWFRLLAQQKKYLTAEQFEQFLMDGPIFTEFPATIMNSIRSQMPAVEAPVEEEKKPAILDATGLPAQSDAPKILDATGHVPPPKV